MSHQSGERGPGVSVMEGCFYGNYFLGICAVAQAYETAALLRLPPVDRWFAVFLFGVTVLFYTHPYLLGGPGPGGDPRTRWYRRHFSLVRAGQIFWTVVLAVMGALFFWNHRDSLAALHSWEWGLALLFPLAGALYYGGNVLSWRVSLRRVGWLKPFLIGFSWAGLTYVYPILFARVRHGHQLALTVFPFLLFLKNFMFLSVLAMLFDIKDRAEDNGRGLMTFVVRFGLRHTLFRITMPLTLLGILTFLTYSFAQGFSATRVILVLIPFLLLILAAVSLGKNRSMLYYYVVIDGVMLAKALFGIVASHYG